MIFLNLKPEWLAEHNGEKEKLFTLELLAAYGIDPRRVVIEVTEESCHQPLALEKTLAVFRQAGCRVAIDDAGTAYSNLDRIGRVAPEVIKFDCRPFHSSPYGQEVTMSLGRAGRKARGSFACGMRGGGRVAKVWAQGWRNLRPRILLRSG